jgi:YesN/AraC family two-component response regulator
MARKTIKGLEQELELEKSLKEEYKKKVEELEEIIKDLAFGKVVSKCEYDKLLKKNERLQERSNKFIEIIKSRSQNNKETKRVHNERGAGRKSSLTEEQRQKINELHKQNLSYGKIAKEVGLSKAYVYKLIKKQIKK